MAAYESSDFAPVQMQKLFFLLDENLEVIMDGRLFDFEPYDYGPFDHAVYAELEKLENDGLVRVYWLDPTPGSRRFALTREGIRRGNSALEQLPEHVRVYMCELSKWIQSLGFAELVGLIYKQYPDMAQNSIFHRA